MMKTIFFIIISFLATVPIFSQSFSPKEIDENRLEKLILQKLNQHRQELRLSLLRSESKLQKAAAFHSKYQSDNNTLTHDQNTKIYTTPYKRVLAFGGTNGLVGENVAYVSPKTTYEELAEDFYQGWKNSPPHYKNMIHPDFRYSGIRFQMSKDGSIIYGTHVFGGEMYIPPPIENFPIGAYGVKNYNEKLCQSRQLGGWAAESLAYSLFRDRDSIFLYYEDEEVLKRTIFNEKDALAVDIIERRQLPCNSPNLFHGSEVHDGMMLPPVYKKELFEKNKSRHYRGYKLFMGMIPQGVEPHIDFGMITIQDSCRCDYGNSILIPGGNLSLFHINPIWAFAELKQKNYVDTILPFSSDESWTKVNTILTIEEENKTFEVRFEKNKFDLPQLPKGLLSFLKKNKSQIKKVKIEAFSSVEGPTSRNLFLQKKRAEKIFESMRKKGIASSKMSKKSIENWDLFFAQIGGMEWQDWKNKKKSVIKNQLKNKTTAQKIEPLLAEQRVAKITITFDNKIETENYSTTYFDDFRTANDLKYLLKYFSKLIATNKTDSALLVQYDLIQQFLAEKISIDDLTNVDIPIEKENLPLLSNQLSVELFFRKWMRTDSAFIQRVKQMAELDKNYLPMKFNLYGFATRYLYSAKDTILNMVDLEFDIPDLWEDKTYRMTYLDPQKTVERLLVNFHLGAVEYYSEKKEYEFIGESLEFIKDYFIDQGLTELETLRLALYFNRHGRSSWALELLYPYVEKGNYLENTLFTYVQTISPKIKNKEENRIRFLKYGEVAAKQNSRRFCNWINTEFQLLRENDVKQMYCKFCE